MPNQFLPHLSSLNKVDAAADDRNKNATNLLPRVSLQYSKSHAWHAVARPSAIPWRRTAFGQLRRPTA